MDAIKSKAKSAYLKYHLAREHLNETRIIESVFRKGFVMGYHTALGEAENKENPGGQE